MMPLEAEAFDAGDAVGDPYLSHVVRLGRGEIPVHHVLQPTGKDLAVDIAGQARRLVRREDQYDGPGDIDGNLCRHPAVIIVHHTCCGLRQGFWIGAGSVCLVIVTRRNVFPFPFFRFCVTFECQWLDHLRLCCHKREMGRFSRLRFRIEVRTLRTLARLSARSETPSAENGSSTYSVELLESGPVRLEPKFDCTVKTSTDQKPVLCCWDPRRLLTQDNIISAESTAPHSASRGSWP